jgi:hypothetical protein
VARLLLPGLRDWRAHHGVHTGSGAAGTVAAWTRYRADAGQSPAVPFSLTPTGEWFDGKVHKSCWASCTGCIRVAGRLGGTFPDDTAPGYLLRDRDRIYGDSFRPRMTGMHIQEASPLPEARGKILLPNA